MPIVDINGIGQAAKGDIFDKVNSNMDQSSRDTLDALGIFANTEFKDKDVNNFVKGLHKKYGAVNDPTFLGFTLMFDWYSSPLFKGCLKSSAASGTDFPEGSALRFLNFRNQSDGPSQKVTYLSTFTNHLQIVNQEMPWYFQSIEGLDVAYKKYMDISKTYKGGDDSIIALNTLESIDLKVSTLMDLYTKAVYDLDNRRHILPNNLKYFDLYIYVEEIRSFNSFKNKIDNYLGNVMGKNGGDELADLIKTNTSQIIFKFTNCMFIPMESSEIFTTVTNTLPEQAKNKIVLNYKDVVVKNNVAWLDFELDGSSDDFFNIKNKAKAIVKGGINSAVEGIKRLVKDNIYNPMGNVWGQASIKDKIKNVLSNSNIIGSVRNQVAEKLIVPKLGNVFK